MGGAALRLPVLVQQRLFEEGYQLLPFIRSAKELFVDIDPATKNTGFLFGAKPTEALLNSCRRKYLSIDKHLTVLVQCDALFRFLLGRPCCYQPLE